MQDTRKFLSFAMMHAFFLLIGFAPVLVTGAARVGSNTANTANADNLLSQAKDIWFAPEICKDLRVTLLTELMTAAESDRTDRILKFEQACTAHHRQRMLWFALGGLVALILIFTLFSCCCLSRRRRVR